MRPPVFVVISECTAIAECADRYCTNYYDQKCRSCNYDYVLYKPSWDSTQCQRKYILCMLKYGSKSLAEHVEVSQRICVKHHQLLNRVSIHPPANGGPYLYGGWVN